jgi:hypothetical protein
MFEWLASITGLYSNKTVSESKFCIAFIWDILVISFITNTVMHLNVWSWTSSYTPVSNGQCEWFWHIYICEINCRHPYTSLEYGVGQVVLLCVVDINSLPHPILVVWCTSLSYSFTRKWTTQKRVSQWNSEVWRRCVLCFIRSNQEYWWMDYYGESRTMEYSSTIYSIYSNTIETIECSNVMSMRYFRYRYVRFENVWKCVCIKL